MLIKYLTHRYGGDHAMLDRAELRLAQYNSEAPMGVVYVAPWIKYARSGVGERRAWQWIGQDISQCDGVVHDYDGASALSDGQLREGVIAKTHGKTVETGWLKSDEKGA